MNSIVLTVENHHVDECGAPPNLVSNQERYVSFWQDSNEDQFVFVYEMKDGDMYVLAGDAGWENKFVVLDFETDLICDMQTRLWIAACASIVKRSPLTAEVLMRIIANKF